MAPGYYSTQQAAAQIGVTRATLHNWMNKGIVPAPRNRVGRNLVWTRADIARLRAARKRIKRGRPRKGKAGQR